MQRSHSFQLLYCQTSVQGLFQLLSFLFFCSGQGVKGPATGNHELHIIHVLEFNRSGICLPGMRERFWSQFFQEWRWALFAGDCTQNTAARTEENGKGTPCDLSVTGKWNILYFSTSWSSLLHWHQHNLITHIFMTHRLFFVRHYFKYYRWTWVSKLSWTIIPPLDMPKWAWESSLGLKHTERTIGN